MFCRRAIKFSGETSARKSTRFHARKVVKPWPFKACDARSQSSSSSCSPVMGAQKAAAGEKEEVRWWKWAPPSSLPACVRSCERGGECECVEEGEEPTEIEKKAPLPPSQRVQIPASSAARKGEGDRERGRLQLGRKGAVKVYRSSKTLPLSLPRSFLFDPAYLRECTQ